MGTVTCLRSVLMKPEHEAWMGEIWEQAERGVRRGFGRVEFLIGKDGNTVVARRRKRLSQ